MKRINHILVTAMVLVLVAMFANADIPPAPAGLNNDTGNYWVNYTWSKDLDHPDNENVTDSFNVSMNGTWYNGTATFLNESVGPGGWANITVWAYNATGNGNLSVGSVSDSVQAPAMVDPPDDNPCTIMHPDSETLVEWIARYNAAPKVNISGEGVMAPPEYSVLDRLDYNATERNQGWCGNCWVWAATGCMEVAHDVENDVFDRLSIQYLNSLYYDGTGDGYACEGGNLDMFVDFYSVNTTFAVPWNNTNASWQDWAIGCTGSTTVPAASISTTPHYTITHIEERTITTQGVGNATAIDNIKSVLASDNAIWFAFYLPTESNWTTFYDFWDYNAETDLWSPDYSCGHTWVGEEGGGHAVLCVGYNDSPDIEPYWIMLNSWGASTGRPNGLFRMNMDINYDCYFVDGDNWYSLCWQMLDIDFAVPTPTNLQNTTGNYWVNYTWDAGTGIVTDGYNVSMNDEWYNRTGTFLNSSVGAGNWSNITVWAYNASGAGTLSTGGISDEVQAPAAPAPAITSHGNDKTNDGTTTITVNESVSVRFNASADQTIDTWNWYNNTADQLSNFDNYTTSWSVNGTDTISVNATNANGTSNTVAWAVTVNDITAPAQVQGLANDTPTTSTVNLSWTANIESDLAGYRVYKNGVLLGSTVNAHYNATGLSPSTTYEFNVSAYDDNDLKGENASIVVTTAAVVYPAPAITSHGNNKTNDGTTTITVNESVSVRFNASADQTIEAWHWYKNGADQSCDFDNYTTSWSVNGTNTVSVNATNANGTTNTVAWTVTVNDITPPAQVTNLINDTPTTSTVNLSWGTNTDADLAGYRVYKNGTLLGSTVNAHYNATGLLSSTTYEFSVSAYDDNDLKGENASIVVTTAVGPLHHIDVTPDSKTLNISESWNFSATGYDQNEGTISGLVFEWDHSDAYIGSLNGINDTDTATNFTAEHVGVTYITASNGSVASDPVQVTVNGATNNTNVTNETVFTATSGGATVTGSFSNNLTGWINTTAIGNATNSSEVNSSNPRSGLGSGDKVVSGVIINVSDDSNIASELGENGTIRIEICYNAITFAALGIDASTLAIWKYNSTAEKWVTQPSTATSERCVYTDVKHLCTFGLVGSKATPSGGGTSSGGSGTYPPGWFGTPTPTVTATKAPAATTTATAAPPGERVTPAPTKKPAMAKGAAPAAEGTTAGTAKKSAPGFPAVFAIAGMLAVAYAMMRRRE